MAVAEKPLPLPTEVTKPYWEGLNQRRVLLPRCAACGSWNWYPRNRCIECLSDQLVWTEVSGRGTIHTFTIGRQPTHPAFADDLPQLIIVVELDEGPKMTSTLVGASPEDLRVGAAVEPVFDQVTDTVTLLRHRLAG